MNKKENHYPKNIFQISSYLSPKNVFSQINRACFEDLPYLPLHNDQDAISTQYLKIFFLNGKVKVDLMVKFPIILYGIGSNFCYTQILRELRNLNILRIMRWPAWLSCI